MQRLIFDATRMEEAAEDWWRSLTPALRGVYLQALWEIEGCPPPRPKQADEESTDAA